ncbi:hypothetical protein OJAV_G00060570 [Oryzias javanicus]|uniref:Ubiquinone biosynthesis protein n=1 Tax=Oryzias javanicus TaxID=123683 RepID=A0A437DBN1_ORYJA|nr:hypothetical protein OJAV_G00060570 [Oryzias javanicus]
MATLLRGLRAAGALRGLGGVLAPPTATNLPLCRLRRGFYCAARRLQDEDRASSSSSSSSSFHQHYQAHSAEQDAASPYRSDAGAEGAGSSEEQDEEYESEEQLQARILTAALEFVPLHGWSMEAIAAGAESLGLYANDEILAEQHNRVQLGQAEKKKTSEFLRDAVETRLRMYIPYMETWPQAMSLLLLPHNIPDSLKHLSNLVDDIWYYAGDRSTDMNWYTKRAVLTGIYNTTELVMVQDSSPDFQDTWAFLDNRIQDVVNMATTAKQVQSTGEAVVQGLMGAAVTLKNLSGLNQRR